VAVAAVLVTTTLDVPEVVSYSLTPPAPVEVGAHRVGPITVTVDASVPDAWTFFDFSRGSVVESPQPAEWDLAFQRHRIIANGGPGLAGGAGVVRLAGTDFDSVGAVPPTGYVAGEAADSVNPALERWYDYSWTSHLLQPKPDVYALRTADGRYAKFEILGYYCPGAQAGCVTIRYVYQGAGGFDVRTP
jgi:hypothetical protein